MDLMGLMGLMGQRKLEDAGYVSVQKRFLARKPHMRHGPSAPLQLQVAGQDDYAEADGGASYRSRSRICSRTGGS
jgi:hypothetical protein